MKGYFADTCGKVFMTTALIAIVGAVALGDAPTTQPAAVPGTQPAAAGKPVIQCDKPVHDFGVVMAGPMLKHSFELRNAGDVPLNIERVKPSCGCTIAGSYPKTIEPGQSGLFPFSLASSKLHSGPFSKTIQISSNDPVTPELRLTLKGECKHYVDVKPAGAYFGILWSGTPETKTVTLMNNTDSPMKPVLKPVGEADKGKFDVKIDEKTPGKEYLVHVTTKPPYPRGQMASVNYVVETGLKEEPTIMVRAVLSSPTRIDVRPAVVMQRASASATDQRTPQPSYFRVAMYDDKPIRITEWEVDDPAIELKLTRKEEGKSYSFFVTIPADHKIPPAGRTITLKTDDKETPVVKVPVKPAPQPRAAQQEPKRRPAFDLVGKDAPKFKLETLGGREISNDDFAKHPATILNFVAPNCGYCKRQVPNVEKVRAEYEAKGVRFVNVVQKMRTAYTVEKIKETFEGVGSKIELAPNTDNSVGQLYSAVSYPTMFVIDRKGKVADVAIGARADLVESLKKNLDAMISGGPLPAPMAKAQSQPPTPPQKKYPVLDLIGKPAPAFKLDTLSGKAVSNADFAKNPATILNFVAPNCGFCKKQVPEVEKVRAEYEAKGVRFVNVVQKMRTDYTVEKIKETFEGVGSKIELAPNLDNSVGQLYQARSYPTMVIVDRKGNVADVSIGAKADLVDSLKKNLDAMIEGKPLPVRMAPPAQAQTPTPPPQPKYPAMELVGKPAPAFKLDTLSGKSVSDADFAKHPATVLNFVAPNCGFCKKQIPNVEKVRAEYEGKGVRFVNVVQKMRTEYTVEQITEVMNSVGSKLELAPNLDNSVGQLYQARSYPTMFIVDRKGKVADVSIGAKADLVDTLKKKLDELTNDKPPA